MPDVHVSLVRQLGQPHDLAVSCDKDGGVTSVDILVDILITGNGEHTHVYRVALQKYVDANPDGSENWVNVSVTRPEFTFPQNVTVVDSDAMDDCIYRVIVECVELCSAPILSELCFGPPVIVFNSADPKWRVGCEESTNAEGETIYVGTVEHINGPVID